MPILRFAPAIAWAAVIFVLSSVPNPPGATGSEWQSNLAHMTEYAVLALLLVWACTATGRRLAGAAVAGWLVCLAYGVSDEYHQSFVANRDSNGLDVAFDALGAAIGALAAAFVLRLRAGP